MAASLEMQESWAMELELLFARTKALQILRASAASTSIARMTEGKKGMSSGSHY
jgi:hypothetical protein